MSDIYSRFQSVSCAYWRYQLIQRLILIANQSWTEDYLITPGGDGPVICLSHGLWSNLTMAIRIMVQIHSIVTNIETYENPAVRDWLILTRVSCVRSSLGRKNGPLWMCLLSIWSNIDQLTCSYGPCMLNLCRSEKTEQTYVNVSHVSSVQTFTSYLKLLHIDTCFIHPKYEQKEQIFVNVSLCAIHRFVQTFHTVWKHRNLYIEATSDVNLHCYFT